MMICKRIVAVLNFSSRGMGKANIKKKSTKKNMILTIKFTTKLTNVKIFIAIYL